MTEFKHLSNDAICLKTGKDRRGKQIIRVNLLETTKTHLSIKLYCSSEKLLNYWFDLSEEAPHMLRFILAEWCNRFLEHSIWPEDMESTELVAEGGWYVFTIKARRRSPTSGSKT